MKIILLIMLLNFVFDKELNDHSLKNIDNSIIILTEQLYCKDCFYALSSLQYLWDSKYKTIVITTSHRNIISTKTMTYLIKLVIKYDNIYFVEKDFNYIIDYYGQNNIKFIRSPSIIFVRDKKSYFLPYDSIFKSSVDTVKIKNIINNLIK